MKYSLKLKISILFLVALISVIAIAFFSLTNRKHDSEDELVRYTRIALISSIDRREQKINFDEFASSGFMEVTDKAIVENILKKSVSTSAIFVFQDEYLGRGMMGNMFKGKHGRRGIGYISEMYKPMIVEYSNDYYLILHVDNQNKIYLATFLEKNNLTIIVIFTLLSITLLFLYLAIIKSIKPLGILRNKIREFSNGNDNIDCKINGNDEIAEVANEFDNAVKKIKAFRSSRQLFLRNIMHELKTPIMRGKLSIEMIDNDTPYKKTLEKVFDRQESLIREFLRIEQLGAGELKLEQEEYYLRDIVDYSLDIIGENSKNIQVNIDNIKIYADFDLFATAIKNLLDNAILYSTNQKATITTSNNKIIVKNTGKKLEFELERYREPFFLQGTKQKESRGLGFGLFITIHLIELHNMKIKYDYINGENIFTILLKKH